jgi:integrase
MAKLRPTKVSNLDRDEATGTYYARVKVDGKRKVKALGTDNLSTARRKLNAVLDQMRGDITRGATRSTIIDLAEQYRQQSAVNPNLSPRTKEFHSEICGIFRRCWAGPMNLHDVKIHDSLQFLTAMVGKYSTSRSNALQSLLVWIGKEAHRTGLIHDTHAFSGLPRRTQQPKQLTIPDTAELERIMGLLRDRWLEYRGWTYFAVQMIAHTGCRASELGRVTWADVDTDRRRIRIQTSKSRAGAVVYRYVPWVGDIEAILGEIRLFHEALDSEDERIIPLNSLNAGFRRAFSDIGTHLTPHDFRHLFATRCIESGVDIQTVSRWLGHSDGGALAMKFYGHLTDSHSQAMAEKVRI